MTAAWKAVLKTSEPRVAVVQGLNARDIPKAAAEIEGRERRIIDFCRSREFSPERLREVLAEPYRSGR